MQRKKLTNAECPIARSLDEVGEWWSILLMRDALQGLLSARGIEERENLHQWLLELLPLADDRALGLIRQLIRRLTKP